MQAVQALAASHTIASVNMSLGGGAYTGVCDNLSPSRALQMSNLKSLGIATIVSSGNEGSLNGLGMPACLSSAISVGSSDNYNLSDDPSSYESELDTVSCFTNIRSDLTLLAPGIWIPSALPGGGYDYITSGAS
jgi:hypothetical protein